MSMESLEQATGSAISARGLYMAARGLDDRPVAPRAQEKSVGAERTFDKDTQDMRQVTSMLRWCCDDVAGTLRRRGLMARKVMVKLRFPDLSYATKGTYAGLSELDRGKHAVSAMCRIIAGHDGHAGKLYRRHFVDHTCDLPA